MTTTSVGVVKFGTFLCEFSLFQLGVCYEFVNLAQRQQTRRVGGSVSPFSRKQPRTTPILSPFLASMLALFALIETPLKRPRGSRRPGITNLKGHATSPFKPFASDSTMREYRGVITGMGVRSTLKSQNTVFLRVSETLSVYTAILVQVLEY